MTGFLIHRHFGDLQAGDQSTGFHIPENGFESRLLKKRLLYADYKELMGAGDVEQSHQRLGAQMSRSEGACGQYGPISIRDYVQSFRKVRFV